MRRRCPQCGAGLRVGPDLSGRLVRCPRCHHRWVAIVVPANLSEDELPALPGFKAPLRRAAAATAAVADIVRDAVSASAPRETPATGLPATGLPATGLPAAGPGSAKLPISTKPAAVAATPPRTPQPPPGSGKSALPALTPAATKPVAPGQAAVSASLPHKLPKRLGQFELVKLIGRGGMGLIFEARDSVLNRPAAVKLLRQDTPDERRSMDRFLREARAAARIEHPNIMPIWQVGRHEDQLFLAMPLIRGGSCGDWLRKKGPMAEPQATWIISEAARGLAAAHAAGVVHRDIKPSNLLLDENGSVRVADFGLAKASDESINGQTREGQVIGTPHYMSPEQARGKPADPRSDIYALGATYFHLLTGQTPYSGASTIDILQAHVRHPPPDPRVHRPELSEACVAVIARAMAKRPAERYSSAAELADDLADMSFSVSQGSAVPLVESRISGSLSSDGLGDSQALKAPDLGADRPPGGLAVSKPSPPAKPSLRPQAPPSASSKPSLRPKPSLRSKLPASGQRPLPVASPVPAVGGKLRGGRPHRPPASRVAPSLPVAEVVGDSSINHPAHRHHAQGEFSPAGITQPTMVTQHTGGFSRPMPVEIIGPPRTFWARWLAVGVPRLGQRPSGVGAGLARYGPWLLLWAALIAGFVGLGGLILSRRP